MKTILAMSASVLAYAAHMAETCETVLIKGKGGNPVAINKSDYDADPDAFTLHKDEAPQPVGQTVAGVPENVIQQPAPSAPDFKGGEDGTPATPLNIDPATGAAMPQQPAEGQYGLLTEGTGSRKKFFPAVTDASGQYIKVENMPGLDEKGYKTDQEAWDALQAAIAVARITPGVQPNG